VLQNSEILVILCLISLLRRAKQFLGEHLAHWLWRCAGVGFKTHILAYAFPNIHARLFHSSAL
jgi:hypothetical protein